MKITERKILIIDDEVQIIDLLKNILEENGFKNIYFAKTKKEALISFENNKPDFLILDIMLPDGSGYEIIEEIRKSSDVPILFLSALSDIEKQYKSFDLGGDDYMVKPFLAKELILRIKAILKRTYGVEDSIVKLKDSTIDFEKAIVVKNNEEIQLTAKEYNILKLLYENKNKILSIDGILSSVWGEEYYGYENSMMAHIRRIREKIEKNPSKPKNLITYKGLGYKLKVE